MKKAGTEAHFSRTADSPEKCRTGGYHRPVPGAKEPLDPHVGFPEAPGGSPPTGLARYTSILMTRRLGCLGAVLLAVNCTEGAASLEDAGTAVAPAKLTHVSGKVLVKRSNGDDWINAVEAMDLKENDKVRTAAGASASIDFASGGTVSLGEDAMIAIAETRVRPGLERSDLTVLRGRVEAELPDVQHQSISVTTPNVTVRAGRKIEFQ